MRRFATQIAFYYCKDASRSDVNNMLSRLFQIVWECIVAAEKQQSASSSVHLRLRRKFRISILLVAVGIFYVLVKLGSFIDAMKEKTETAPAKK